MMSEEQLSILRDIHSRVSSPHASCSAAKEVEALKSAIPAQDYQGHHDYHIDLMERARKWQALKEKVFGSVMEKLAWGALILIGLSIWEYVKKSVAS